MPRRGSRDAAGGPEPVRGLPPSPGARRSHTRRGPGRGVRLTEPVTDGAHRPRAPRLDPDVRRGLIVEAAERLLVEHDPLSLTFDQVAVAAGVSRSLVHAYLGDRRGLIDAIQVRIIGRLDTWVGHGLSRSTDRDARLRAMADGLFAFVEAERDGWSVLAATGGFDHPALHGVRGRWAVLLSSGHPGTEVAAQAAVAALLLGVSSWVNRGVEPADVVRPLIAALDATRRPDGGAGAAGETEPTG